VRRVGPAWFGVLEARVSSLNPRLLLARPKPIRLGPRPSLRNRAFVTDFGPFLRAVEKKGSKDASRENDLVRLETALFVKNCFDCFGQSAPGPNGPQPRRRGASNLLGEFKDTGRQEPRARVRLTAQEVPVKEEKQEGLRVLGGKVERPRDDCLRPRMQALRWPTCAPEMAIELLEAVRDENAGDAFLAVEAIVERAQRYLSLSRKVVNSRCQGALPGKQVQRRLQ
jgi:hypothetical protein